MKILKMILNMLVNDFKQIHYNKKGYIITDSTSSNIYWIKRNNI